MEESIVTAVTHDMSESKVTIAGLPDQPGVAAKLFREIAGSGANIDMIVQNVSDAGSTDISFTVPREDLDASLASAELAGRQLGASDISADSGVARVSVIGAGMKSSAGVAALMFETLAANNVNIEMISTSSIRISCVIRDEQVEQAVQSLHSAFGLDA